MIPGSPLGFSAWRITMIFAAKSVQDAGAFSGRIKIGALVDEEGMMLGAKHFVAHGHAADVDAAICCEPEAGEGCPVSKALASTEITLAARLAGA